jgi:hypothetical protein
MRITDSRSMSRHLPPSPNMPSLPTLNIARDTLPAYNAEGQGLVAAGPRPAPPVMPTAPRINIPQGHSHSLADFAAGKGAGQGFVPNTPLPSAPQVNLPKLNLNADYARRDRDLSRYNLRSRGVTPQAQYNRPSHTLEIYGQGPTLDISHINKMGTPMGVGADAMNHGPSHNFGGDPRVDAQMAGVRPTAQQLDPREALARQKDVKLAEFVRRNHATPVGISGFDRRLKGLRPTPKQIPIHSMPILPAANIPSSPKVGHLVQPAKRMDLSAQYIAPPIRNGDMGGTFASMSTISGNIGMSPGRAFGAEAHLFR